MDLRFLEVESLRWWQILPVVVACWTVRFWYVRAVRRRAASQVRFARLSRRSGAVREIGVLLATLVAAGALVFALMRPQVLRAQREPEIEQQDLVVMLDRSASMRARDIAPSRFGRATAEIRNFLLHKPEGIQRVALVGFADSSLVLSYLTADVESVAFYLDWIADDPHVFLGTDIGAALKSGLEVDRRDTRKTHKIFLLVSDGEDYGEQLQRQVLAYRAAGYHVHTIGIGSDQGVTVPVVDEQGRESPLRDEDGRILRTRFSESTLRQIAAATGGRYLRSRTGNELVGAIADAVNAERKIVGYRTTTEYRDVYQAGLAVAAAAAGLLWLLL
ncbi:MAG: VWA domain-containing protein [Acidobacteria bacterium]|nr:VWA domain-containing protein [Acidobacteriota bacterium]